MNTKIAFTATVADGSRIEVTGDGVVTTIPAPAPTPIQKDYVLLNCINWNAGGLNNLPLIDASEFTYFVLSVDRDGGLVGMSNSVEMKFVNDVRLAGKKPTFSIAGGSQNIGDITRAVTVKRNDFINNIINHISQLKYSGVFIDIENTSIDAQAMADFVVALKQKLNLVDTNLTIGIYTQPYQLNTVWAKIQQAADSFDFICPMIYDFNYTIQELKDLTLAWLPKTKNNPKKLLCGLAVNYPTGLNSQQYGEVLEWVKQEGLRGVGLWNNVLFTEPWRQAQRLKFQNLE